MTVCSQCNSSYDETKVNIPNPIPNGMCAECGTTHSTEALKDIIPTEIQERIASQTDISIEDK
jgi:hypothetical protein